MALRPDIPEWQYKIINVGPSTSLNSESILNALGAEGWDLVTFQPHGERAYPGEGSYYLKRPGAPAPRIPGKTL